MTFSQEYDLKLQLDWASPHSGAVDATTIIYYGSSFIILAQSNAFIYCKIADALDECIGLESSIETRA